MANSKYTRVLSIDGGGIRGVIPGQILVILEEKLKKRFNNRDARIADYFDLIAGTSTGGILTIAYLCPDPENPKRSKFNAEQVVNLYLEHGHEIFDISLLQKIKSVGGITDEKYNAAAIEKALHDYFGETKLSQLLKPCLITSYDIKRRQAHFFTQHDAVKNEGWDYLAKDVARATSAAPTFFECSHIDSLNNISYPLVDGGVFVNNPTLCAYAEVHKMFDKNPKAKEMAILSLGTGFVKKSYNYDAAKNWGVAQWIKPLIDIMMSGVSEVVDYQIKQMFDAAEAPNNYLRVNTELPNDVNPEMDDASKNNLIALKALGTETAQKFENQIDQFIELLAE